MKTIEILSMNELCYSYQSEEPKNLQNHRIKPVQREGDTSSF